MRRLISWKTCFSSFDSSRASSRDNFDCRRCRTYLSARSRAKANTMESLATSEIQPASDPQRQQSLRPNIETEMMKHSNRALTTSSGQAGSDSVLYAAGIPRECGRRKTQEDAAFRNANKSAICLGNNGGEVTTDQKVSGSTPDGCATLSTTCVAPRFPLPRE